MRTIEASEGVEYLLLHSGERLTSRDGRQRDDKIRTIEASEGVEYLLLHSGERLSLADLATLRLNWQGEEKLIKFAPTN
ncbi:hypothetical protein A6767_15820 [Aeromonas veronii]|nr:hypothetical protein A6767_15820 [Aeromonas veronii]